MNTVVGLVATLITSGGLGLLLYLTFRAGRPTNAPRRVTAKRVSEVVDERGEGRAQELGKEPGRSG